jgi:hypothetical protein
VRYTLLISGNSSIGPGVTSPVTENEKTQFVIFPRNAKGEVIAVDTPFQVIISNAAGNVPSHVTAREDHTFQVEYAPSSVGALQVEVKFLEKQIQKSPFKIQVESSFDSNKVSAKGRILNFFLFISRTWT